MKVFLKGCVLFLILVSIFSLIGEVYVYRYPRLTLDPSPRATEQQLADDILLSANGAYIKNASIHLLRAFQPDVSIEITFGKNGAHQLIQLENIHPEAKLQIKGTPDQVLESISGLRRMVKLDGFSSGQKIQLIWRFPVKRKYRFAAFGDTGGGEELSWDLIRAHAAGADFILHLGDSYYDASDVGQVGERLNAAQIPVYTTNGNHDFRGPNGNSIDIFLKNIGPLNAEFSLLGHCFINLDSGAFMYPPNKGERANILAQAVSSHQSDPARCTDYIIFTHKPIISDYEKSTFPQADHTLHGYDARWMLTQIQMLGNVSLLAGHIHRDFQFEQDGFSTYVSGNGLAMSDLIERKRPARLLVGEIQKNGPIQTQWIEYEMPMRYHCSKKVYHKLLRDNNPKAAELEAACNSGG